MDEKPVLLKPDEPDAPATVPPAAKKPADEFGGSNKPEPTRYGDWEIGGKCVDF